MLACIQVLRPPCFGDRLCGRRLIAGATLTRERQGAETALVLDAFSEAQFKTLKYCLRSPGRFGALEDARTFGHVFFLQRRDEHHDSGSGSVVDLRGRFCEPEGCPPTLAPSRLDFRRISREISSEMPKIEVFARKVLQQSIIFHRGGLRRRAV
jgi:hypothetical protein